MTDRCQLQYLHPQRLAWVDCAKPAPITLTVDDVQRVVCPHHRDEYRRAVLVGLSGRLRWSEHPTQPRRPSRVLPGQLQLVEPPAAKAKRRWPA